MENPVVAWLWAIVLVGIAVWFVWHAFKHFGWHGLFVKFALYVDGVFLVFVIAVHETPWTAMRHDHPNPFDNGYLLLGLGAFWLGWDYLLISDRPMRRLMKPPVKWALHFTAALVFVGVYAARKGWL
ncbi:MAG: hypothetical protein ACLQOO_04855 [Terriglobia bacterium]